MAVVAALVGILVLAAAAHYYYTSYDNEQAPFEYHESYKPPEEYWSPPIRHEYNYEENSVDILPERSYVPENSRTISVTAPNGGEVDSTMVNEIKSQTTTEENPPVVTSTTDHTSTTTVMPESTTMRHHSSGIEYAVGSPQDVDIKTLKTNEFYEYKVNSETQLTLDTSDLEFRPLDHARPRDPVIRRDKEKPREAEKSAPSTAARPSAILEYFLKLAIKIMVVLL